MGGSIRVVVKANDRINVQTRWTNPLPSFVKNPLFIECNEQHITEYLNQESRHRNPTSEELFSPTGYGLDVFDFDKKRIYSLQGYSSYDIQEFAGISLSRHDEEEYRRYTDLWEKKYMGLMTFKVFDENWRDPANQSLYVNGQMTFEAAMKHLKADHDKRMAKRKYVWFQIQWEKLGWQLKRYEEDAAGYKQMLVDLIQDGYPLSIDAQLDWQEQLTERETNESED